MVSLPNLLEQLEIPVVVHDIESGEILASTAAIEALYGYSEGELQTMTIADLSAEDFTQSDAMDLIQAAADGESPEFEWQIQRGTGELIWISVRLERATIDGTPYVFALPDDITDYKIREGRLKLLQRFTRHNLRTQVQIIQGFTGRVQEAADDDAIASDILRVQEATAELLEITDTINNLKTATEQETIDRQPVRLSTMVTDVISEYRSRYPLAGLDVECVDDPWVSADEGLRMAFEEAIQNTVDHNEAGGLTVQVQVFESPENGHGVIRITDNGELIPQLELDAVEVDYDPDQIAHGEGAGIWLMHAIVESLGGRFSVRRASEEGNELEFSLPQTQPPATA